MGSGEGVLIVSSQKTFIMSKVWIIMGMIYGDSKLTCNALVV